MDVSSIRSTASAAQTDYAQQVAQLAEANRGARLDVAPAVTNPTQESANVTTSPSFSPQAYAQAAHFAVLAQAGAFAAAQSTQASPPPAKAAFDVPKVDAVGGANVNTVN